MSRATKLISLTNVSLLRQATRSSCTRRGYRSQEAAVAQLEHEMERVATDHCNDSKVARQMNWIPHPRSGIYFPEGQDWVMNGVPDDAASLGQAQTYWLRDLDGVERHDPDVSSADYYFLTPEPAYD